MKRATTGLRSAMFGALPVWIASRVAVALVSLAGMWTVRSGDADALPSFARIWDRWDVGLYTKVARYGYFSDAYPDNTEPFLPAMPVLMRVVHTAVPDWIVSGLLISFVAGAVACVALWRLAAEERGPDAGSRAVLYLVLFPYAVFLFAGYSEALFLAFATTAWLAARHDRWWLAGLLAAGASATRITGVCLGLGLIVEYVVSRRRARRPLVGLDATALLLPFASVAAYFAFLHSKTGYWDSYSRAQKEHWGRDTVSPLKAFRNMWDLATNPHQSAGFLWSWRVEILAVLLGVVLTLVLLWSRRFGEAVYVGSNTAVLSVSSFYASGVRAVLVWFPLFLLLARVTDRRDWLHNALIWVCAPLMAAFTITFTTGSWTG